MDNLTHTLVGAIAGEVAARWTRPVPGGLAPGPRRALLVTLGAVGASLPDIDVLWTLEALTGDKLDYMVHHRGHTHTLLGCLLLAWLLRGAGLLWARWRGHTPAPADRRTIGLLSVSTLLLHLAFDALNNYGIHPFWPFDNRWYYGDAAFIIEPLFWLASLPLLFLLHSHWARGLLVFAILAAAVLVMVLNRADLLHVASVLGAAALLALLAWRLAPRWRAVLAAGAVLCLAGGLLLQARAVARDARAEVAARFPLAQLHDVVHTPDPTQPRCASLLLVMQDGEDYVVHRARHVAAGATAAGRCPDLDAGAATTARWVMRPLPDSAQLLWQGEYRLPLATLRDIARACRGRRFLQFARVPFVQDDADGRRAGDLRFDREAGPGFTELSLPLQPPASCDSPSVLAAPWQPPLLPLLTSPRGPSR
ncbi:MAG: hypothetical protein RL026_907 [Pseudomonadota bacterium]